MSTMREVRWFVLLSVACLAPMVQVTRAADTPDAPSPDRKQVWLPVDASLIVVLRPKAIAEHPALRSLIQPFGKNVLRKCGVDLAQLDSLTMGVQPIMDPRSADGGIGIIAEAAGPLKPVQRIAADKAERGEINGVEYHYVADTGPAWCQPNANTWIWGSRTFVEGVLRGSGQKHPWLTPQHWASVQNSQLAVAANVSVYRPVLRAVPLEGLVAVLASSLSPVIDGTDQAYAGLQVGDELHLTALLVPVNGKENPRMGLTLRAVNLLAQNAARGWAQKEADTLPPGVVGLLTSIGSSSRVEEASGIVRITASAAVDGRLFEPTPAQAQKSQEMARRMISVNNLKQLALAMHNHHDVTKKFPPASAPKPSRNTPADAKTYPCSWRVRVLPYIEQTQLYNSYRFDEPWDSEHNKTLLDKMPAIFRHPNDDPDSTHTSYFVLTGPDTIFPPDRAASFRDVVDGSSNTLMMVEAKRAVPWTKPEDIEYDASKPLPELGGWNPEGFSAALADGSVRFVSKTVEPDVLRKFITPAGREIVHWTELQGTAPPK